jgi:ribosomal protein L24E
MSPQLVEAYGLVVKFCVDKHHMYIKTKKDPREEWVQTKYKITKEDIQLVMQD